MKKVPKLRPGDKVAILSPSFAAPAVWPHVHELGLRRLREVFNLVPVEYPTTRKLNASGEERAADLIAAFTDPEIKAVIATIGGDDQVTYIKNLSTEPFINNPKPFFGYSDNSHLSNFLFLNGIPSFYGGSIFTQYAMQGEMDEYTIKYLRHALFEEGEFELLPSETFTEKGQDWNDLTTLNTKREHQSNVGWHWDGVQNASGILWGGCVECVDEMFRHDTPIPTLEQFNDIVLIFETSEEIPSADYVYRFFRALGERGILKRVQGVLIGRPKAWEFDKQYSPVEREEYRQAQNEAILKAVRTYNKIIPVVQNLNFGHTDPQIPMPYGNKVKIDLENKLIIAKF